MNVPGTDLELVDSKGRALLDPAVIEAEVEEVRGRLTPRPAEYRLADERQVVTPDQMIDDLEWSKWGVSRIAYVLKEANRTKKATARVLRVARANALQATEAKSADLREADVALATQLEQELADDAEIVFDFARDTARGIESTASQTQTQAGLVKKMYDLAGSGRES